MKRLEAASALIHSVESVDIDSLWEFLDREYQHEVRMKQLDNERSDDKEMRKLEEGFTRAVAMK